MSVSGTLWRGTVAWKGENHGDTGRERRRATFDIASFVQLEEQLERQPCSATFFRHQSQRTQSQRPRPR